MKCNRLERFYQFRPSLMFVGKARKAVKAESKDADLELLANVRLGRKSRTLAYYGKGNFLITYYITLTVPSTLKN